MKEAIWMFLVFSFLSINIIAGKRSSNRNEALVNRSFAIDYENNGFVMDGRPFRYISGSMHYFRVPPEHWSNRMKLMTAAGLNALQTYVLWNEHEPLPGVYNFKGRMDLLSYIQMAADHGLYVILRAGPYICSEVDLGGLPYWILTAHPNVTLRTSDPFYLEFVDRWMNVLLPMIKPFLYQNGGPIISVQVENEYGSYYACDFSYMRHLRDLFRARLGDQVVLFTTDGDSDRYLKCGKVDGLYATVDFSPGANVNKSFSAQRSYEPRGPLVNSEYYTYGHLHWGFPQYPTSELKDIGTTLYEMLKLNASVNMYTFHGGTNFGFIAGANTDANYTYLPDTTSYDFQAPISESGLVSNIYYVIRDVIQQFTAEPLPPIPKPLKLMSYGNVNMEYIGSLFELLPLIVNSPTVNSLKPLTFEELEQAYGFVLYETVIPKSFMDPSELSVAGVRDRGYVFVDYKFAGILSRTGNITTLPLTVKKDQMLSILVENQGRLNYGNNMSDFQGLISIPTLDGVTLLNWKMTRLPLNDTKHLEKVVQTVRNKSPKISGAITFPAVFSGVFTIEENETCDTFLLPAGWGKGVAIINGFNLGRYWPAMGAQVTLYVPKGVIFPLPQQNNITIFELQAAPCLGRLIKFSKRNNSKKLSSSCLMKLIDQPVLDGTTPHG